MNGTQRIAAISKSFVPIYIVISLYCLATVFLFLAGGIEPDVRMPQLYLEMVFWICLVSILVSALVAVIRMLLSGETQPTAALLRHLSQVLVESDRPARAANVLILFVAMIVAFSTIKSSLPSIHPFTWDRHLMVADRALFGGYDAWVWTAPLFGNDLALIVLNFAYNLWLITAVGWVVWVSWLRERELQMRCLFAMMFGWFIAGNLLAIWWSSAGPCFVYPLYGDATYKPLMDLLHQANGRSGTIWALTAQDLLWAGHTSTDGLISGISAMPSLHVLFSVLIVSSAWGFGLTARIITVAFALTIWIGSIQLAWHYALDGIVGAVLALLFWKLSLYPARWSVTKPTVVIQF